MNSLTIANKTIHFWSHDDFIGNLELCILVYGEEREWCFCSWPWYRIHPNTHTQPYSLYGLSLLTWYGIIVRLVSPWDRSDVSSSVWCGSAWKEIGERAPSSGERRSIVIFGVEFTGFWWGNGATRWIVKSLPCTNDAIHLLDSLLRNFNSGLES